MLSIPVMTSFIGEKISDNIDDKLFELASKASERAVEGGVEAVGVHGLSSLLNLLKKKITPKNEQQKQFVECVQALKDETNAKIYAAITQKKDVSGKELSEEIDAAATRCEELLKKV
jgi:uncharacterized UPF0160 family protein